ncbi:hypothetical protein [Sphaerothrix gracilis]|uniref:hypothetical protein n=1 Tax=Sphaerothrix gracilis TaxID=3151835 RepID=UPI0031FD77CC
MQLWSYRTSVYFDERRNCVRRVEKLPSALYLSDESYVLPPRPLHEREGQQVGWTFEGTATEICCQLADVHWQFLEI